MPVAVGRRPPLRGAPLDELVGEPEVARRRGHARDERLEAEAVSVGLDQLVHALGHSRPLGLRARLHKDRELLEGVVVAGNVRGIDVSLEGAGGRGLGGDPATATVARTSRPTFGNWTCSTDVHGDAAAAFASARALAAARSRRAADTAVALVR